MRCPVCGGDMALAKTLPGYPGPIQRFKCTCGHAEEVSRESAAPEPKPQEDQVPEGFYEFS